MSKGMSAPLDSSSLRTASRTLKHVPTGTVLFMTSRVYLEMHLPNSSATSITWDTSAEPSSLGGVPTAMKTISTMSMHSRSDVAKCSLPSATFLSSRSCRPSS